MFGIGGSELLVIVFVALLVFGPSRLPEIARTVKRGYQEWARLRNQMDSTISEIRHEIDLKADLDLDNPKQLIPPEGTAHQQRGARAADRLSVPEQDDYLAQVYAAELTADSPQEQGPVVEDE